MYFVDSEFGLHDGAFVGIYNDSNEVWKGEISVFNVDPPHMALFDAATGKKQQIRLVQHKQAPPGRFRVYWQFEEPCLPARRATVSTGRVRRRSCGAHQPTASTSWS